MTRQKGEEPRFSGDFDFPSRGKRGNWVILCFACERRAVFTVFCSSLTSETLFFAFSAFRLRATSSFSHSLASPTEPVSFPKAEASRYSRRSGRPHSVGRPLLLIKACCRAASLSCCAPYSVTGRTEYPNARVSPPPIVPIDILLPLKIVEYTN